jgi:pimeloyl-ACP methyl ester carboxylesterase
MKGRMRGLILDPHPLRKIGREILKRSRLGSYEWRLALGAVDRPFYGYIVYQAASLAARLGYRRISILEFGVGGGDGLRSLEEHAERVSKLFPVAIQVYGFDTGVGLPEPGDYRDLPFAWKKGFYPMNAADLRARLKRATLVLGDLKDTAGEFFKKHSPAPIGAIAYDLDFYSSTAMALDMLNAPEQHYLPRVFCYFDDIIGSDTELHCDWIGERLAIREFNEAHHDVKIDSAYHLLGRSVMEPWCHQIRVCHFFQHSRYNDFAGQAQE